MNVTALEEYHRPDVFDQLVQATENHQMEIIRDDGLYRHIRFQQPGTGIWSFDLVAWPGYLTLVGDIGAGCVFHRAADMFDWFTYGGRVEAGHVNLGYWSQKVVGNYACLREFSWDKARDIVHRLDTVDRLLSEYPNADEDEARSAIEWKDEDAFFEAMGEPNLSDPDFRDGVMDFREDFVLTCHAILWGIRKYYSEVGR